jgi:toxin FitB
VDILLAERKVPVEGAIFRVWMNSQVLPAFAGRILPVDTAVALQGARLHAPDPRPVRDAIIAATALVHRMTVVTNNVADFERTGAPIPTPGCHLQTDEIRKSGPEENPARRSIFSQKVLCCTQTPPSPRGTA